MQPQSRVFRNANALCQGVYSQYGEPETVSSLTLVLVLFVFGFSPIPLFNSIYNLLATFMRYDGLF